MKLEKNSTLSGYLFTITTQVTYGLAVFYWKAVKAIPSYELLAMRIVLGCVTAAIFMLHARKSWRISAYIKDRKGLAIIFFAGIALTLNWGAFIWGVNSGHVVETSIGPYLVPIFTALGGVVFLRERPDRYVLTAFALAVTGVVIMTVGYGHFPFVAILLAVSYASYLVLKKGLRTEPVPGLFFESLVTLPVGIVYLVYLAATGQSGFLAATPGVMFLSLFSGFITVLPLYFAMRAQQRIGLIPMGLLAYITPVMHTLIGVFVYREDFTVYHLVMLLLIFAALTIFTIGQIRKSKAEQAK